MPSHQDHRPNIRKTEIDGSTRLLPNPPRGHTQLQHSCGGLCIHVDRQS